MTTDPPAEKQSLWTLTAPPLIWAGHLLLSYCTAAIWCAKFADAGESLGAVRVAIAVYTLLGLVGIALFGWRGWKEHRSGGATLPHDADSRAGQRRFLGFSTFLLSGLSGVAILYQALAAVFVGSCQ
jgi:hypothetical protein